MKLNHFIKKTDTIRHFVQATFGLALAFGRAAWFFRQHAIHILDLPAGTSLSARERRRLQHYFYGTTYLAAIFCLLRGRPRTRNERHIFIHLAALAYFFDDLADTVPGRSEAAWINDPEAYGRREDPSGLALHFLANVYELLPPADVNSFKGYLNRVFAVETRGRQRETTPLSTDELEQITQEKGGCSVLLFRRALAHPLSTSEEQAWMAVGNLIQLCDDIFDVWFDHQAGTTTLATGLLETGQVRRLQALFEARVQHTQAALAATPFAPANRGATWRALYFLVAITRVCLDHYEKLQEKLGTLPLDDRHAMVVDMERWDNRLRAALRLIT